MKMRFNEIMTRKSAILLAISLSIGLISSGLHAAKKAPQPTKEPAAVASKKA
jgi:hypothetical protein